MQTKKIITTVAIIIVIIVAGVSINKSKEKIVENGDTVHITYQAIVEDGSIFDQAIETIQITIGEGSIPGIDSILMNTKNGDTIVGVIGPDSGYGKYYDPSKVKEITLYTLTQIDSKPITGENVIIGGELGVIREVGENSALRDTNPAHTRQDIQYTIHIRAIDKNNQ